MGLFLGPLGKTCFGVMGLFFGPHRPIFNDFLKTKNMRNVRTIILAAVSSHIEPYGPISNQIFRLPDAAAGCGPKFNV